MTRSKKIRTVSLYLSYAQLVTEGLTFKSQTEYVSVCDLNIRPSVTN